MYTKLNHRPGRTFKTAAFCVSCPAEGYEHLFYNDSVWPDGTELHDWYYKLQREIQQEEFGRIYIYRLTMAVNIVKFATLTTCTA